LRREGIPERQGAERVQSDPTDMTKTPAQFDDEIAAMLSEDRQRTRSQRRRMSQLHPVEGLRIPADSRDALIRFWRAHPGLRRGCLSKYGFDPIDDEEAYWRFGLAEPDHRDVLRAVRRNDNNFSLPLVKRWEVEEQQDAKSDR
jgi:hypothetical protein